MHASSAREAPYWGSGISTWFDKKPREHRAAFVIGSLEAAEEVSSSGARELFIRCSAPAIPQHLFGILHSALPPRPRSPDLSADELRALCGNE